MITLPDRRQETKGDPAADWQGISKNPFPWLRLAGHPSILAPRWRDDCGSMRETERFSRQSRGTSLAQFVNPALSSVIVNIINNQIYQAIDEWVVIRLRSTWTRYTPCSKL